MFFILHARYFKLISSHVGRLGVFCIQIIIIIFLLNVCNVSQSLQSAKKQATQEDQYCIIVVCVECFHR